MNGLVATTLDAVVVALLLATIGFAFVLNRRLSALRAGRDELERLLREVERTLRAASGAAASLQQSAETTGSQLQSAADRAMRLRTELAWMVEVGDRLAERLERLRPSAQGS